MAGWNTPALYDTRTRSYAPSWRWEFSGEPFLNFSHRAAGYRRKLFPPSVNNTACKAAEQGEEAARCLGQGLPAERLYYGDWDGDETDDSSNFESDVGEELTKR
jgi:hypothetical protein